MKIRILNCLLALACSMWAQNASVSGRVTHSSGSAAAGARLEIKSMATGVGRQTTSNQEGLYALPLLPPGDYEMRVEHQGFRSIQRSGISLDTNQVATLDFILEVGAVSDSIKVTGETPLVSLSDATVGKVIEGERIASLPLNGRNTLALVTLTPNVRYHGNNTSGFTDRGSTLSAFSVNGGPNGANNITLDGTTNVNSRSGDANVNPTVDAIEEFKVQSGVMSALHGFTAGGVVSLVSKSGTNSLHGTLYEFLRNDKLDARNFFATRKTPLRFNQFGGSAGGRIIKDRTFFFANFEQWRYSQQYAAIGTTPTVFERQGDFSQLRDTRGVAIPIYDPATTVPNPNGGGFARTAFPGNVIPSSRLDPVSLKILPYFPLPNRAPDNVFTNLNNFSANLGSFKKATQIMGKADHSFSNANRLSFRYMVWDHRDDQATNGLGIFPDRVARVRDDKYINRNFNLSDLHTFSPSLINDLRIGVSWMDFGFAPLSLDQGEAAKLGFPSSVPGRIIPQMFIAGYQGFPTGFLGTIGYIGLQTYQIADTLNWIRGRHSIKVGADIRRFLTNLNLCQRCSGSFDFTSRLTANPQQLAGTGSALASFVMGSVASASVDQNAGASYLSQSYSFFVQDDWKATRRLTLNFGLRYDYQEVPAERNFGLSNFDAAALDPNTGLPGRMNYAGVDFSKTLQEADKNDFGPRVGFALDVQGNGKTVLRGGYGIYYPLTAIFANAYATLGFRPNVTNYVAPGGNADAPALELRSGFPTPVIPPLGSKLGPSAFLGQNVTSMERTGRTPYSQQFNLVLQHNFKGILFEGGYSGNKGTKFRGASYDFNQMDPKRLSLGSELLTQVPNPYAGRVTGAFGGATISRAQSLRPLPYYGSININNPLYGSSIYHSFLFNAEKRMSNGVTFLASFTFGKLIADSFVALNDGGQTEGVNVGGFQAGKYDRSIERAIEATDSAKRLVVSGIYELPFGKGRRFGGSNRLMSAIVGGWQLNCILVRQDGLPLVVRGANNNAANRPNSTGVSANLPADERSRLRWFDTSQFVNPPAFTFGNVGRTLPDVRSPGIVTVDVSSAKNIALTERVRLQFRAEFFNALNHANFLAPNTTFVPGPDGRNSSGSFGVISGARDPRIGQLGLKLLFLEGKTLMSELTRRTFSALATALAAAPAKPLEAFTPGIKISMQVDENVTAAELAWIQQMGLEYVNVQTGLGRATYDNFVAIKTRMQSAGLRVWNIKNHDNRNIEKSL
jgi:hypothetical protein